MASAFAGVLVVFLGCCSLIVTSEENRNATHHKVKMTCDEDYCASYCCYDSWNNWICCSETDITDMWWFWVSFATGLLFLSLCCGLCCRRHLRHRRYFIITGEQPATVITSYGTENVAPIYSIVHPYHGYPEAHLPPYTPVPENKGNPPSYT
ncbi:uncharacterized protein LOC5509536 [Nematostella vectensis]|uniref:uncharacterized protein LOC5509536 n=1 Tax=Nematostella vectensis TaxID=45351 RepID=UPI00138FFE4A|nr:uncharacterized protein LOC5509536 [Nematostella vectensis]